MVPRQADACPYLRPFKDGFDECPAYQRRLFLAVDTSHEQLAAVNTCAHLQPRRVSGPLTGFYAACALGDAAGRKAWAERFEADRLARIRELSRALSEATREASGRMWEAKADQLRAVRAGRRGAAQTRRVMEAATDYEVAARRELERRRRELDELGLEVEPVVEMVREALVAWAGRTTAFETYQPSPEVLERFPPELRAFLSPNAR